MKPDLFDQHTWLKSQYPGFILLLHVGDFYEVFDVDADTVARICNLAKTARGDHRMAGFPHTHLDRFLTALVRAGFQVATCELAIDGPLPGKANVVRWNPCAEVEGSSCRTCLTHGFSLRCGFCRILRYSRGGQVCRGYRA